MNKKLLYALPLVAIMVLAGCTGTDTNNSGVTDNVDGEGSGSSAQGVTVTNPEFDSSADSDSATAGITLAELQKHDSASDCWMAIDGKVYDVTNYIAQHPGEDEILRGCGIDATAAFRGETGGHSHSSSAELKKEEFLVGDFAG